MKKECKAKMRMKERVKRESQFEKCTIKYYSIQTRTEKRTEKNRIEQLNSYPYSSSQVSQSDKPENQMKKILIFYDLDNLRCSFAFLSTHLLANMYLGKCDSQPDF